MRQLTGQNVTFEGNTYQITEIKEIDPTADELYIQAKSPTGEAVTLIYSSERNLPSSLPDNYSIESNEINRGSSTHELIVRPSELEKGFIFNLSRVN